MCTCRSLRMYHIVEFVVDGGLEVAIVPDIWMKDGKSVYWPPYKTSVRVHNAARKEEPPSENTWSLETISRVLYSNVDFDKVRMKLKQSEETSDLQTSDGEHKRKRKPAKKLYDSSSDASGDGDEDNGFDSEESETGPTPSKRSVSNNSPLSPVRIIPPQRLPVQALLSTPNSNQESVNPGPSETPVSRLQPTGPTAVTQILTMLELMREENKEMKRLLHRLLARSTQEEQEIRLPENINLPVSSVEEMDALDDTLMDQTKMLAMLKYLSLFGGTDLKDTVDWLMKHTMTTELARMYNLKGLKGKRKFADLQLLNVMHRCVQKNWPTRSATKKEMDLEVSKWLTGARDRDGGRKARNKVATDSV